jgi:CubicO group peptidase (beta-lactamase class C family)
MRVAAAGQQPVAATPAAPLNGFDQFVDELRAQWNVPGMAVGIIQNGKIILAKGYGYRDLEQKLPVTPKTLFAIGSTSKSFTSLSLAILNDQGKVDWDKPVRQYLPAFQVQDPIASERLTLRDLLSHRSGLARHDLVWYSSSFTSGQIFDRVRYLEMNKDFRSAYQYNNLMYTVAGYLGGEVSGLGWEKLVQQSILDPLGMKSTNFHVADSEKSPDYALPYSEKRGSVKRIPFKPVEGIGPAGEPEGCSQRLIRSPDALSL